MFVPWSYSSTSWNCDPEGLAGLYIERKRARTGEKPGLVLVPAQKDAHSRPQGGRRERDQWPKRAKRFHCPRRCSRNTRRLTRRPDHSASTPTSRLTILKDLQPHTSCSQAKDSRSWTLCLDSTCTGCQSRCRTSARCSSSHLRSAQCSTLCRLMAFRRGLGRAESSRRKC